MQTKERAQLVAEDQQRVYKRTLTVVVVSQVLAGLGLSAGVTVGALLAEDMLGSTSLAGAPSALFTLGSAGAALIVGRLSQRRGRRVGLSTGYLAGAIGGAGVLIAAIISNPVVLFASLFVYGSGMSTNLQARYAGTDVAPPQRRGQAVSTVLVATTFGAVAGPNLVGPMGGVADAIGIPELAGPFLLSIAAYGLAALVLTVFLRPDPLLFARGIAASAQATSGRVAATLSVELQRRGIAVGAAVMIVTQVVMVSIMTMTPIHMRHHGHGLSATGVVIGVHIAGMYLPSPITGFLVDRIGRILLVIAAGVTLPIAGFIAALAPTDSVAILALALGLLGVGWNFGLVAGTAMITDAAPLETRAATQGTVDVGVALSGAGGGIMSGVMVATTSYATLSLVGGGLALALIPVVVMAIVARPAQSTSSPA
ncbi:MAG TPA: MFS transporter [Thermomicrobiales bacterium]|nr:MFS transporter [Thermomicrobiales bacterium]